MPQKHKSVARRHRTVAPVAHSSVTKARLKKPANIIYILTKRMFWYLPVVNLGCTRFLVASIAGAVGMIFWGAGRGFLGLGVAPVSNPSATLVLVGVSGVGLLLSDGEGCWFCSDMIITLASVGDLSPLLAG